MEKGWKCVYIDLEETSNEDGFLKLIIEHFEKNHVWKQITEGMAQGVNTLLEKIKSVSIGPVEFDLTSIKKDVDLYKSLKELIRHDEDTLIAVDELTLFLGALLRSQDGKDRVSFILNWLRSLRQVSGTKVRWLFCSSVGLKNFTASLNLTYTINDLRDFKLDELTREEAHDLLKGLCEDKEFEMNEEMITYALEKLHWNIPFFIQLLFAKLDDGYDGAISKENVDYAKDILKNSDCQKIIINYDDKKIYYDNKEESILC